MQHSTEKLRWRYYNHEKIANRMIVLEKSHVDVYTENDITLYAYQTRDLIDDEVFIVAKAGHGVVI